MDLNNNVLNELKDLLNDTILECKAAHYKGYVIVKWIHANVFEVINNNTITLFECNNLQDAKGFINSLNK